MLHTLRRKPSAEGPTGPETLLLACHKRLRHFSAVARRLAVATTASPEDVATAAHALHRYFREALPLHEADEEESMTPRLLALDASLEAPLARMAAEHRALATVLAELVPRFQRLTEAPGLLAHWTAPLDTAAAELERVLATHLTLEETTLFPRLAALDEATREALVAEMRGRRAHLSPGSLQYESLEPPPPELPPPPE